MPFARMLRTSISTEGLEKRANSEVTPMIAAILAKVSVTESNDSACAGLARPSPTHCAVITEVSRGIRELNGTLVRPGILPKNVCGTRNSRNSDAKFAGYTSGAAQVVPVVVPTATLALY